MSNWWDSTITADGPADACAELDKLLHARPTDGDDVLLRPVEGVDRHLDPNGRVFYRFATRSSPPVGWVFWLARRFPELTLHYIYDDIGGFDSAERLIFRDGELVRHDSLDRILTDCMDDPNGLGSLPIFWSWYEDAGLLSGDPDPNPSAPSKAKPARRRPASLARHRPSGCVSEGHHGSWYGRPDGSSVCGVCHPADALGS